MAKPGRKSKKRVEAEAAQARADALDAVIDPQLDTDKATEVKLVTAFAKEMPESIQGITATVNPTPAESSQGAQPPEPVAKKPKRKYTKRKKAEPPPPAAESGLELDENALAARNTAIAAQQLQLLSAGAEPLPDSGLTPLETTQPMPILPSNPYTGQTSEKQPESQLEKQPEKQPEQKPEKKSRKRKRKQPEPDPDNAAAPTSAAAEPLRDPPEPTNVPAESPVQVDESTENVYPPVEPPASHEQPQAAKDDDVDMTSDDFKDSGPFSKVEFKRITNFAEGFQERHNLTKIQLNNLVQDNNRKPDGIIPSFWKGLQERLPKRNITALRKRTRREYHNYDKRGLWDDDEDEKLRRSYEAKPDKWVAIGVLMGRMPEDCRDRWRNYISCGDQRKKQEWTQKEEQELENAVTDCINVVRDEARQKAREKGRAFRDDQDWESKINFNVVSTKLNHTRSRLQCYQHWRTMKHRLEKLEQSGGRHKKDSDPITQTSQSITELTRDLAKAKGKGKGKAWREAESNARYEKMLPGDKYNILQQILAGGAFDEDNIRWAKIKRENPDSRWVSADRKYAFRTMKQLLPEQPATLAETLKSLIEYFQKHHADELNQFYDGPLDETRRRTSKGKKRKATSQDEADAGETIDSTAPGVDPTQLADDAPTEPKRKKRRVKAPKPAKPAQPVEPAEPASRQASIDSVLGTGGEDQPNQNLCPQPSSILTEAAPMAPMAQMQSDAAIDPQLQT